MGGLVARDAGDLRGDAGEPSFDEFDEIAVDRGLIPVFAGELRHHLGVRERAIGGAKQPQRGEARRRGAQTCIVELPLERLPRERLHRDEDTRVKSLMQVDCNLHCLLQSVCMCVSMTTRQLAPIRRATRAALLCTCIVAPVGCGESGDHGHETELITTVQLEFLAEGRAPIVAAWRDPDGFGGAPGSADPIQLAMESTYTMSIRLLDESLAPAFDLTDEIAAEGEEHQLLIYGAAVHGPASASATAFLEHAYADAESTYGVDGDGEDLPVGLRHTITVLGAGNGELKVMLRHLPELNGEPQKDPSLATLLATGQPLPGDVDVDVSFSVTVL